MSQSYNQSSRANYHNTSRFAIFNTLPGVLTSMIFHVFVLVLLALMFVVIDDPSRFSAMVMAPDKDEMEAVESDGEIEPVEFENPLEKLPTADLTPVAKDLTLENVVEPFEPHVVNGYCGPNKYPSDTFNIPKVVMAKPSPPIGCYGPDSPMSGRSGDAHKRLLQENGGSRESEDAVDLALKWITSRQSIDGGWNFNHNKRSINEAACPDPGTAEDARNGATAVALLPFLGAGHTHKEGAYRKQVYAGLAYLVKNMKVKNKTGSWHEDDGRMYSHGLASIAMCEAYAMTHDKELLAPAQLSLNYIVYAQDPVGGGWRYEPRQPGDTSAVGWQLIALKSGHMAYLQVPKTTILGAIKFLDSVQADSGAQYGYTNPAKGRNSTTAIGLLSRMYLGWKHDNPALESGVATLDKAGPSKTDMYYNYYATQVCHHYGGEVWTRWNNRTRDWLIESQDTEGVKAGSWHMPGGHANERGGRLYITALATMMLEVYYRGRPIYRKSAVEEEFQL